MSLWLGIGDHCGIEKLEYKNDIVLLVPKIDVLFIQVKGAGINTIIGLKI